MKKVTTPLLLVLFCSTFIFAQAPKKVLIEEFTGTWCGFCPKAASTMKDVLAFHPNAVGVANHKSDPMSNTYTVAISSGLNVGSYPNGAVDRFSFTNPGYATSPYTNWKSRTTTRLNTPTPVAVNFVSTYNSTSRILNVTVIADFVDTISGDLRINCILVEDSVVKTNSPQKNYYGQNCSHPDSNSIWYNYPCTIPDYKHLHVARRNLSTDHWGTAGVIPMTGVQAGSSYNKSYVDTIPSSWNTNNMHIVAFVSRYGANVNEREILNTMDGLFGNTTTGVTEDLTVNAIEVQQNYPNPFSETTAIQFRMNRTENVSLKVYDVLGNEINTIYDGKLIPGDHTYYWAGTDQTGSTVAPGVYYYRIVSATSQVSKPMMFLGNR